MIYEDLTFYVQRINKVIRGEDRIQFRAKSGLGDDVCICTLDADGLTIMDYNFIDGLPMSELVDHKGEVWSGIRVSFDGTEITTDNLATENVQ